MKKRISSKATDYYLGLGRQIRDKGVVPKGVQPGTTALKCFEVSVNNDPEDGECWAELLKEMKPSDKVLIEGKEKDFLNCASEAIKWGGSEYSSVWMSVFLYGHEKGLQTVSILGKDYTLKECLSNALSARQCSDNHFVAAGLYLVMNQKPDDEASKTLTLGDREVTAKELFSIARGLNPKNIMPLQAMLLLKRTQSPGSHSVLELRLACILLNPEIKDKSKAILNLPEMTVGTKLVWEKKPYVIVQSRLTGAKFMEIDKSRKAATTEKTGLLKSAAQQSEVVYNLDDLQAKYSAVKQT